MGKFKVIVSDKAKKDLLEIKSPAIKHPLKKSNALYQSYISILKKEPVNLNV